MKCGVECVECEGFRVKCEVCSVQRCGVLSVKRGVWNVECVVWNRKSGV